MYIGPEAVEYCSNHSEVRVIFASSVHMPALIALAGTKCPTVKVIISMDSWADIEAQGSRPNVKNQSSLKAWGAEKGIAVMDLTELLQLGSQFPHPHIAPLPTDIASLCYTSGTTGA